MTAKAQLLEVELKDEAASMSLPERPDSDAIDRLLVELHMQHWNAMELLRI